MTKKAWIVALVASALSSASCATSFQGDAHYPGGPKRCAYDCKSAGMHMSAFVYAGEYSSACVCAPGGEEKPAEGGAEAAAAAGGVGVVLQMRAAAQQNAAAMKVR